MVRTCGSTSRIEPCRCGTPWTDDATAKWFATRIWLGTSEKTDLIARRHACARPALATQLSCRAHIPVPALPLPRSSHVALTFLWSIHAPLRPYFFAARRPVSGNEACRCVLCARALPTRRRAPSRASVCLGTPQIPTLNPPHLRCHIDGSLPSLSQTHVYASPLTHSPLSAQVSARSSRVGARGASGCGRAAMDRPFRRRSRGLE